MANFRGDEQVWLKGGHFIGSTSFTPTASAYGAGDLIDVAKQITLVDALGDPIPPGALIRILSSVIKISETSVPSGQTSFTGHFYSVTPPSAQADNAAWSLAAADLSAYRGSIAMGTPVDLGAALHIKTNALDSDMKLADSTVWMELITDGAHTPAAVARQVVLYGLVL